jgi:hypothetical protein
MSWFRASPWVYLRHVLDKPKDLPLAKKSFWAGFYSSLICHGMDDLQCSTGLTRIEGIWQQRCMAAYRGTRQHNPLMLGPLMKHFLLLQGSCREREPGERTGREDRERKPEEKAGRCGKIRLRENVQQLIRGCMLIAPLMELT